MKELSILNSIVLQVKLLKIKIVRKKPRNKQLGDKLKNDYLMNEQIRAPKVRLIDSNGENVGVTDIMVARKMAEEQEIDLVLIAPNAEPPVARIIDWSKFKYEQSKKARHTKGSTAVTKEWQFSPKIEDRDIDVKMKQIKDFLAKGNNKVKLTLKAVKKVNPLQMKETMGRIVEKTQDFSTPLSEIQNEGRNLTIFIKKK